MPAQSVTNARSIDQVVEKGSSVIVSSVCSTSMAKNGRPDDIGPMEECHLQYVVKGQGRTGRTDGRTAGVLYASLHICACLPHSYTRMRKTDGRYIVSHTNTKTTRTRVAQVPFCFVGFMGCEHVSVPVAIIPSLFFFFFFFTLAVLSLIFPSWEWW